MHKNSLKLNRSTKNLCFVAMLISITVLLAIFGTFRIGNFIKIPLKFISVFIAAALFGPITGGITAAVGDILNALIAPVGPWIPLLTVVEFLSGFTFGIFLYKKKFSGKGYILRAFLCALMQFLIDMFITTYILTMYSYFPSFYAGFGIRLAAGIIKMIMQFLVVVSGLKFLPALSKELGEKQDFKAYANSFQVVTRPGLERINELLKLMDNPEKSLKCIHIAGTNGKGSVAAFLQEMITKEGYCCGKYISPNLIKVNERISINGKEIDDKSLEKLLDKIETLCGKVQQTLGEIPTQFEIWTAAAFKYFKDMGCDYVVLETGLGGRFDATNAIETNILSVITRIDIDHTAYLGNTPEEIAFNKAGIIKKGSPVVTIEQIPGAAEAIEKTAAELGSEVLIASVPKEKSYNEIYQEYSDGEIKAVLSLGGTHQLENAAISVRAAKKLGLKNESIIFGLENAKNPARFEKIGENMIFDGAHNPNGVKTLADNLKKYYPGKDILFVMAAMKDKDIKGNLNLLKEIGNEFRFVAVKNNERSSNPKDLKSEAESLGLDAKAFDSLKDALEDTEGKLVVICGSLYLYKDLKECI